METAPAGQRMDAGTSPGWIERQRRRVEWRLRALRDPAHMLARDPRLTDARPSAALRCLEAEARRLPFLQRLRLVTPTGGGPRAMERLLLRRLRTDDEGHLLFDLGDGAPVVHVGDAADRDRPEYMEGALMILAELLSGPEFFTPQVALEPGDTVLDLGGNFGTSALVFSPRVGAGGRVFSFEPIFHEVLRRNVRANGLDNVSVIAKAVGDRTGTVEFNVSDKGIDSRISRADSRGSRRSVELTSVDAFVAEQGLDRVDFIKADIEGAEELAIEGARETIARFRPRWSVASYHTNPSGQPQHDGVVRLLREAGYEVRELERRHVYAW